MKPFHCCECGAKVHPEEDIGCDADEELCADCLECVQADWAEKNESEDEDE